MADKLLTPDFNRLARSNILAQLAEQIALAASPLVAVLAFSATAAQTSWIQAAQTLPFLLMSIPSGLLADRFSHRRVLVFSEIIRTLAFVFIGGLLLSKQLNLYGLALLGFVGATATVVYTVTAPAIIPSLVPTSRLTLANGKIEVARTTAFAFGPAIAGSLVAWAGGFITFTVTAALSACAAALLFRLPTSSARPQPKRRDPLREIGEGLSFVFRNRYLRPIFVTQFLFGIAMFIVLGVFVPYAINDMNLSAQTTGLVLSAYGIGMVLGAWTAPRMIASTTFGRAIGVGPISAVAAAALMAGTLWYPSAVLAALSFFVFGVGPTIWIVSTTTLRQSITPVGLLGRVSSINVLAYGARPLGAAIAAIVAAQFGTAVCLVLALAIFIAQALVIVLSPAIQLNDVPNEADD